MAGLGLRRLLRFQFFPSCCQNFIELLGILDRLSFNSFPVAAVEVELEETLIEDLPEAFNSFPVAAKALASWLLINLSSAIFEVHEISLALPSDT